MLINAKTGRSAAVSNASSAGRGSLGGSSWCFRGGRTPRFTELLVLEEEAKSPEKGRTEPGDASINEAC